MTISVLAHFFPTVPLRMFDQGKQIVLVFLRTCRKRKRLFTLMTAAADLTSFLTWKNCLNFRNHCLARAYCINTALLSDLNSCLISKSKREPVRQNCACVTKCCTAEKSKVSAELLNEGSAV